MNAVALRVHAPETPTFERPELNVTLAQAFELYCAKALRRRNKNHRLPKYRTAVRRFEQLMPGVPIGAICNSTLDDWYQKVLQTDGVNSPETANADYRHLRAIFNVLATPDEQTDTAILERVPKLTVRQQHRRSRNKIPVISNATWNLLFDACRHWLFTTDVRVPGPLVGRGVFIWFYSTGLRCGDLWGLQWEDLWLEPGCPEQSCYHLDWPHGWLFREASKTGKELVVPLTPCARRWIDRVTALVPESQRTGQLLPVGDPSTQSSIDRLRQEQRRQILRISGVPFLYEFDHLRKAVNSVWNVAYPGAGRMLTQHDQRGDVNDQHYQNPIPILHAAVSKLDLPESFVSGEL